jgi:ferredoxin
MATIITDDCTSCGACEDECPTNAISLGEEIFVIDPNTCTECVGFHDAQQCALACPVDCCLPDPDRVESEDTLFARAKTVDGIMPAVEELTAETSHFRAGEAAE